MNSKEDSKQENNIEAATGLTHGAEASAVTDPSEKRTYELVPDPPDGGYGWVVVGASSFLSLLLVCALSTTGIFMVEFIEYFQASKLYVSFISSLMMAMVAVTGPILPHFVKRFGSRFVAMAGSFGYSTSFILTSFAPNMPFLIFTLGFITGLFGCSLFIAGQVIVHSYFHKRRTISSALATAGTAVAMFVWPPLTRYLIDIYSWRGANLIMGGICLNGLVAGSLLRPPPMKKVYKKIPSDHMNSVKSQEDDNVNNKYWSFMEKKATRILMFCGWFFILAGHILVTVYLPLRADIIGISKTKSAFLLSAIGITSGCVRIFAGLLGDKSPVRRNILAGVAASYGGLLTVISLSFKTFPTLLTFSVLYAIGGGVNSALQTSCVYDVVGMKNISNGISMLLVANGLSSLIAIPIGGYLYDVTGKPLATILIFGLIQTFGGVCLTFIPFLQDYIAKRKGSHQAKNPET